MSKLSQCVCRRRRIPERVVATMSAALLASACAQPGLDVPQLSLAPPGDETAPLTTGSIESSSLPPVGAEDALGSSPAAHEAQAALSKARVLRSKNQKMRALEVLESASRDDPDNKVLLRERGLLATELGRIGEAKELLRSAIDPAHADWRTHSALGSALAAEGNHAKAQKEFARALELAPDHPSVLNNLALSYALDGKRERAIALLRQAVERSDNAKTKQNLALLLALEGRTKEAKHIAASVLPAEMAEANASYLQDLQEGNVRVSRADKTPTTKIRSAQATAQ